jgi:hypothetical protein
VRERRQREAKERQAERDARSDEAQLKKLIDNGHGHCKEALRLAGFSKEWAKAEFCLACGASIPHREGEGRCELCLEVSDGETA